MKRSFLVGTCMAVALGTAACQDQITNSAAPSGRSLNVSADDGFKLDRGLPALFTPAWISDLSFGGADRAINPADYVCSNTTPISSWYSGLVNNSIAKERAIFLALYNSAADQVPTYEALVLQTSDMPQYYGYDGRFTQVMTKTEKDVKRFWDIRSDDIQVVGMHGSMLLDSARVDATYRAVYGLSPASAAFYASRVRNALLASTTMNGGNHPFFSFNAFAYSTPDGSLPDKIVMGDGILEGYASLGFGDVAPQAIFAHEFGHHIQYENKYFSKGFATVGSPAERTRYTELMADAYAAYFLTHARGASMNQKRVEQFLEVFFQIGDCGFTSSGHHGTPNQRMAAARFGFAVADEAQKQGHILGSEEFYNRFVAAYPGLVAPDAR